MKKLIEFLINKLYRNYRQGFHQDVKDFIQEKFISVADDPQHWLDALDTSFNFPLLHFGGFEYSYNWFGKAHHNECFDLADWKLNEHTIFLNCHFLQAMMGYYSEKNQEYTFAKFIRSICHEVAHCLVYDLYPQEKSHSDKHQEITQELEKSLRSDKIIKLLKNYWK